MTRLSGRMALLMETEPRLARQAEAALSRIGWASVRASDVERAFAILAGAWAQPIDLVIAGNAGATPADVVRNLRSHFEKLPIFALAEHLEPGLDALRAGADDLFLAPVSPRGLARAIKQRLGGEDRSSLGIKLGESLGLDRLVGSSDAFRTAIAIAGRAAASRMPVLILGEAGVGKESLARAIHLAGPRAQRPMVILDCRDIAAGLGESELCGHVRGAFPGAFEDKLGELACAEGGTLLLDGIETLSRAAQIALLHYLEQGCFVPLGQAERRIGDVRIIAAADADLALLARDGAFREDLLARLSTVTLSLPPLRERPADIAALACHMLGHVAARAGLPPRDIDDDALALLVRQPWPGNVRQLQGALLRAALACVGDRLAATDLALRPLSRPLPNGATLAGIPIGGHAGIAIFTAEGHLRSLDAIEADIIRLAIDHYRGRMSEAARRLGIGRSTLYRKLTDLGISDVA